jgi:phage gpG-like protein
MNLNDLLATKAAQVTKYIKTSSLKIIGVEARTHFREGFLKEGFTDKNLEPWAEVKRRAADRMKKNKNGTVSKRQHRDQKRKILTDTSHMRDSIKYQINGMQVEVGTDDDKGKVQAHNEGTDTAGRNRNVSIPQRQFIGKSTTLTKKIQDRFEADITKILNS